jgi:tRNA G18 (ribose-2'-O)-methylase SpoU
MKLRKLAAGELKRASAEEVAVSPKMTVTVVLDGVRSLNNVGSLFRTCDAFAVERMVLCGITGTPPDREIHKTALGAETTVAWTYYKDVAEALASLRDQGHTIVAVEQVEGAEMLESFVPDTSRKYALVFGNEVDGVSQQALDLCDSAIEIPQAGAKHSLNVAVSGGVVLWSFFCVFQKQL